MWTCADVDGHGTGFCVCCADSPHIFYYIVLNRLAGIIMQLTAIYLSWAYFDGVARRVFTQCTLYVYDVRGHVKSHACVSPIFGYLQNFLEHFFSSNRIETQPAQKVCELISNLRVALNWTAAHTCTHRHNFNQDVFNDYFSFAQGKAERNEWRLFAFDICRNERQNKHTTNVCVTYPI